MDQRKIAVNNRTEEKIAAMARVMASRYGFLPPMLPTSHWLNDNPANPDGFLGRIRRAPGAGFGGRRGWTPTTRKGMGP